MENFTKDVRYATRMLLKKPAFTAIAILTLALGIGANTAIFSVVNAVLLRPLPYTEPEKLVMLWGNLHREGLEQVNASTPEFIDYKEQSNSFEQIAAYEWSGFNLTGGDRPVRVIGARVTASLFPLLGVQPQAGRAFSDEEDRPGHEQVALISHRFWQQRFGSDANITEKSIQLNGKSFGVIGVMPAGFEYPFKNIDVWRPMAFTDDEMKEGERVESLPSVRSASVVTALPLGEISNDRGFIIEGREGMQGLPDDVQPTSDYVVIGENYFQTMGIPVLRGRQLNESDNKQPATAVVNETFGRKFFSNEEPLGRRIKLGGLQSPFAWMSIVGVVGDVRHKGLDKDVKPEMYVPYLQPRLPSYPVGAMFLVVRAADNPARLIAAVRDEVQAIDKDQPLANIEMMAQRLSGSVSERRFNMLLLTIFAAVALLLSAIGLYGVMSYSVTRRTHEIGIRMALGAQSREVLRLVIGQGAKLILIGVATGVAAALLLTQLMSSLLFGVSATDAITFITVSLFLTGVALGACIVPARRATRVDPMIALRYE